MYSGEKSKGRRKGKEKGEGEGCDKHTQLYSPSSDAPFQSKDMLKTLDISPSSPAYEMLKKTEQVDFEDYLRDHPNAFSWKNVAEVLYRCGDEKRMDILFTYMKSPEGKYHAFDSWIHKTLHTQNNDKRSISSEESAVHVYNILS